MTAPDEPRRRSHAPRLIRRAPAKLDDVLVVGERAAGSLPHRERMEQLFGAELSRVRAYTGAAVSMAGLGANAAAEGDQIAFAEANPSPGTVAHELTHVLQARNEGPTGDAETEARENQVRVARGAAPIAPRVHVEGIHRDPANHEGQAVDGVQFLDERCYMLGLKLGSRLDKLPILDGDPVLGKYVISGNESREVVNHTFANQLSLQIFPEGDSPSHPGERLAPLVAPESLDQLVRRGAAGATQIAGAQRGIEDGVYWEVVNALVRRVLEALPRVLPRIAVLKRTASAYEDIDTSSVPVLHPMDRVVAGAFGHWLLGISKDFFVDFPQAASAAAARAIRATITLAPAGMELWHWVAASPADATAQEVALAMFGDADLAYRLISQRPRWGFQHDDLARMKPDVRRMVNDFAAAHHPHPALLNAADVYSHRDPSKHRATPFDTPLFQASMQLFPTQREFPLEPTGTVADQAPEVQPIYGLPLGDPALELTRAEQVQPPSQRRPTRADPVHDNVELAEALLDADDLLGKVIARARLFLHGADLAPLQEIRETFETHRAYALKGWVGDHADAWYRHTEDQLAVLRSILSGLEPLVAQLSCYAPNPETPNDASPGAPGGPLQAAARVVALALRAISVRAVAAERASDSLIDTLPESARGPMQAAARAFVLAIQAIDLPSVAAERAATATELARDAMIATLEATAHEAARGNDRSMAYLASGDEYKPRWFDPFQQLDVGTNTSERLAKLRLTQISSPAAAATELRALQEQTTGLQFEVELEGVMGQLDATWAALDANDDFWITLRDEERTQVLEAEDRRFYGSFALGVFLLWKLGTPTLKALARKNFAALVSEPRFKQHFADVEQLIQDEAEHRRWTKLVAAIAICIGSMWVGGAAGAFAIEELGFSTTAAFALNVTADTLSNMALNYGVLDQKPTLGSGVSQLLSFAGLTAINRVRAVARVAGVAEEADAAIEESLAARAGRAVGEVATDSFLNLVIGNAANAIGNKIDTGHFINAQGAGDALLDSAITAVATTIGGKLHDTFVMQPKYRAMARGFGVDLDGLYQERRTLIDEATKLETSPDRRAALDIVEKMNASFEQEQELLKRLDAVAKTAPEGFRKALEDVSALRANMREMASATAVIGVDFVGPGLGRVDAKELAAVVARQREAGGQVTRVQTDPETHLRTVTIQAADGGQIELREKPRPAPERTPPRIAPDITGAFEAWLDSSSPSPVVAQRLRDLYVADPETAIAAARDYGYGGPQPEHQVGDPQTAGSTAARKLDDPNVRALSDHDFSALLRAGYRYDPVRRRFVPIGMTRSGVHLDPQISTRVNEVIGKPLPSQAVGVAVLQLLSMGDAHALRVVGVEPPPGFTSSGGEWGLGRRTSDGEIVLVRGEGLAVDWDQLPGVEPLAHSHPYRDNRWFQLGDSPDGAVKLTDLVAGGHPNDALKLFPSGADVLFCALHGLDSHLVLTPFVDLGGGVIGNPRPQGLEEPITIEIRNAQYLGPDKYGALTAKAEIVVRAGDDVLLSHEMWGGQLGMYMPIAFSEPAGLVPGAPPPKPGSTSAPISIDEGAVARAASDPRVQPGLKQLMLSDPRVKAALHNADYDPSTLVDAWASFENRTRRIKSQTFTDYLINHPGFRTALGLPSPPVEDVIADWASLPDRDRQHAVVTQVAPALEALLGSHGEPHRLVGAINAALETSLVDGAPSWEIARHKVMAKIDEIIGSMASPEELGEMVSLFPGRANSGRRGAIGERWVDEHLIDRDRAGGEKKHPRIPAELVPGVTGKYLIPDWLLRALHRTLDIKIGYADSEIDLEQAHNYDALYTASQTSPVLRQLLGGPLAGHDYLFLPSGKPAIEAARRAYEALRVNDLLTNARVFYVDTNGRIFEYLPGGPKYRGTTIHEAMKMQR